MFIVFDWISFHNHFVQCFHQICPLTAPMSRQILHISAWTASHPFSYPHSCSLPHAVPSCSPFSSVYFGPALTVPRSALIIFKPSVCIKVMPCDRPRRQPLPPKLHTIWKNWVASEPLIAFWNAVARFAIKIVAFPPLLSYKVSFIYASIRWNWSGFSLLCFTVQFSLQSLGNSVMEMIVSETDFLVLKCCWWYHQLPFLQLHCINLTNWGIFIDIID